MGSLIDWFSLHVFTGIMLSVAVGLGLLGGAIRLATRRWEGAIVTFTAGVICALLGLLILMLSQEWGPTLVVTVLFVLFFSVGLPLLGVGLARRHLGPIIAAGVCLLLGGVVTFFGASLLLDVGHVILSTRFLHPEYLALLGLVPLILLFSFRDVQLWHLVIVVPIAVGLSIALFWFGPSLLALVNASAGYHVLILLGVASLVQLVCLLPLLFLPGRRSLAGLGTMREAIVLPLRCLLVIFLALALADPQITERSQDTTVLFVVDRSLSIPLEPTGKVGPSGLAIDGRWERIKAFINQSVTNNAKQRPRDRAGLIVFGRRPRLELPPAAVPRFDLGELSGSIDGGYTDVAAALKLALASFPESTGKRIVLFSDGNENIGLAEEQMKNARTNGVQIDVVPLGAGQRNESEVIVNIEAPNRVEQGSKVPLRVLVRSMSPNPVAGRVYVRQKSGDEEQPVAFDRQGKPGMVVVLKQGLNVYPFKPPSTKEERSYTYEAEFVPDQPIPGDRVQNNKAMTHVVAHGQRRILLLESNKGDHAFLMSELRKASNEEFTIESDVVDKLPLDAGALGAKLSEYDCLILANVAASDVTEEGVKNDVLPGVMTKEQQEVIRSAVHDQGLGLVMIGGPSSFGAGGWQDTPIEKALPVDCDVKAIEVEGKGGLVLVMHASEMANGNYWQKKIAQLAIKKLSSNDEVAVLYYDYTGGVKAHIPMQKIGDNRDALVAKVDSLSPGDMPDFGPALQQAYDALVKNRTDDNRLATKHVIVISDGDPMQSLPNMPGKMKSAGVTVTTVGVATHGAPQDQALAVLAKATGGRFYNVKSANALPEIYTKETRLVSQSYIHENKRGLPLSKGSAFGVGSLTEGIDTVPVVYGLVRTTLKSSALVDQYLLWSDNKGQQFPVLAFWPYGLGKTAAFTSDARSNLDKQYWDKDWAAAPIYTKFWQQVLKNCLRPVESRKMTITTEYRDGKVKVVVEVRDDNGKLDDKVTKLVGKVTIPGAQIDEKGLQFERKNVGVFEAEFKAEEAGSYFVTALRAEPKRDKDGNLLRDKDGKPMEFFADRASGGVTVPYSPEFADVATNTELLTRLREGTGGQEYADEEKELAKAATSMEVFRPTPPRFQSPNAIWWWLVVLVGVLLFFDVALRRIAVEPSEVVAKVKSVVTGLFGQGQAEKAPEFMERLRSRKALVSEALEKGKASRRFDGPETGAAPPLGADVATEAPPSRPSTRPVPRPGSVAPDQPKVVEDYASRLMRAKRKAMEGKDKPKDEE